MEFESGIAFWRFAHSVRNEFRYLHPDTVRRFLQTLVSTSLVRVNVLPRGFPIWRAQLGCTQGNADDPTLADLLAPTFIPFSKERMKPLRDAAPEGRINPKGIPCLYLATDKETAMAEVRPWLGAKISVARFRTVRELRVINCTVHHDRPQNIDVLVGNAASPEEVIDEVWSQVDKAFADPVTENLSTTGEYVATQIIAEAFRQDGFEGIVYKSRLRDGGFSIALFDLDSADVEASFVFSATSVAYAFVEG